MTPRAVSIALPLIPLLLAHLPTGSGTPSLGRLAYECTCVDPSFPHGRVADCGCDTHSLEAVNAPVAEGGSGFHEHAQRLASRRYFRYFRANLWVQCPFWTEEGLCALKACSLSECEDSEIPPLWSGPDPERLGAGWVPPPPRKQQQRGDDQPHRDDQGQGGTGVASSEPGKSESAAGTGSPVTQVSDKGVAILSTANSEELPFGEWDDIDPWTKCDGGGDGDAADYRFYDLVNNVERFTGYAGESAHRIWRAIYKENCFDMSSDDEAQCMEKRIFYRLISGMHASISTHLSFIYLFEDDTWGFNRAEYERRVGTHRERIENLYFLYSLMLRAMAKIGPHIAPRLVDSTGNATDDALARAELNTLVRAASVPQCPETFDERVAFRGPDAPQLREQLRTRFYNISRILDCVGCEKCRLWGKVQVMGLGTALKVLFTDAPASSSGRRIGGGIGGGVGASPSSSGDAACGDGGRKNGGDGDDEEEDADHFARVAATLSRSEIIAFINLAARVSNSMHLYVRYRELVYAESMHQWGLVAPITATLALIIGAWWWSRRSKGVGGEKRDVAK